MREESAGNFSLTFTLLLFLTLLVVVTAYLSYLSIRSDEEDIHRSTKIGQDVLEVD